MKKGLKIKNIASILIVFIVIYLIIGFMFTVLRSNAHYDYFVVKEDSLTKNGKSYWQNNCIEENRENPIPKAQWCVDGFGNFHAETPNRLSWYFMFYSKRSVDFFFVLLAWPIHFLGINLIDFRSVGYGW